MVNDIVQVVGIAIISTILTGIIKNIKPEFNTLIIIAVTVLILFLIIDKIILVFDFLSSIYQELSYGQTFFPVLLKVLGIAYITDFAAQLCRDAGENAIASKTELAGKVIIFYISIPVLVAILEIISNIL